MPDVVKDDEPKTINFDYIKSSNFRVIHADGAFVAGTPAGLTISFYSERQPIPRRVVHRLNPGYQLGDEIMEQRVVRDAIVRDVDIAFIMSLDVAKNTLRALEEIIGKMEKITKDAHKGE